MIIHIILFSIQIHYLLIINHMRLTLLSFVVHHDPWSTSGIVGGIADRLALASIAGAGYAKLRVAAAEPR